MEWRGEKSKKSINVEGEYLCGGCIFLEINKRDYTFIRKMREIDKFDFTNLVPQVELSSFIFWEN